MNEHFTYTFQTDLATPSLQQRLCVASGWEWAHDAATGRLVASDPCGAKLAVDAAVGGRRVLTVDFVSSAADAATAFYAVLGKVFRDLLPGLAPRERSGGTEDMALIPGGRFLMGLTAEEADRLARELAMMEVTLLDEREESHAGLDEIFVRRREWLQMSMPAHEVEVGEFYIARFPVTVDEYAQFVEETGVALPITWKRGRPPGNHFVTGVSWREATAYADFRGASLPTEREWERAAREGRNFFPWGNSYFPIGRIAFPEDAHDAPWPVGSRPDAANVYGVEDLSGGFGEFTSDTFAPYPGANIAWLDRRFPRWRTERVVRGGWDSQQDATTVFRSMTGEDERTRIVKFRLVRRAVR